MMETPAAFSSCWPKARSSSSRSVYGEPPTTCWHARRGPSPLLPLSNDTAEHHEVRPVHFLPPGLALVDEPVGDLLLRRVLDPEADLLAFLDHLPGDVGDQAVVGNEEKSLARHAALRPSC